MKKANEYISQYDHIFTTLARTLPLFVIEKLIKQVQIDTIKETVKLCAEKAKTMIDNSSYCGNTGSEYAPDIIINKESILQVSKQLEKEISD